MTISPIKNRYTQPNNVVTNQRAVNNNYSINNGRPTPKTPTAILGNQNTLQSLIKLLQQLLASLQGSTKPNPAPQPAPTPSPTDKPPRSEIETTPTQDNAIKKLMGFESAPFSTNIRDTDGSRTLSAGDVAVLYGGITGGEIARRTLTAADVQLINAGNTSVGQAELSTNRAKWDAASMGGNYDFTLTIQQFSRDGGRPISISVRDGQVTKAVYQDTGEAAPDYRKLSIEDMFSQAKDAYDTGAERVTTQYDPTTGALSSLYIDRSAMIADEEIGYSVSNITLPKAG